MNSPKTVFCIPKQTPKTENMTLQDYVMKFYVCNTQGQLVDQIMDIYQEMVDAKKQHHDFISLNAFSGEMVFMISAIDEIFWNESFDQIKKLRVEVKDYRGNYTPYSVKTKEPLAWSMRLETQWWIITSPFSWSQKFRWTVLRVSALPHKNVWNEQ